jgi:glucose-6-phosphate isomerase
LTPIGLFPLAAAGMDIERMVEGALQMRNRIYNEDAAENIAVRYAVIRNLLYQKGFRIHLKVTVF